MQVPLCDIIPDPTTQPRQHFDEESLRQLADDILARGQINALVTRYDPGRTKDILVGGERRWRAMLLAGLTHAEVRRVEGPLPEEQRLELALADNIQREDLCAMDLARSLDRLRVLKGCAAKELAEALHISPATVTRHLALLTLPAPVQEMVARGMPPTLGYQISLEPDPALQLDMAERWAGGRLTRQGAIAEVQARNGRKKPPRPDGARLTLKVDGTGVTFAREEEISFEQLAAAIGRLHQAAKKAKTIDQLAEQLGGR